MLPSMLDAAHAAPMPFLRHEGISAPPLLFPDSLARRQDGGMGYEPLDQAVVRSNPLPPALHALEPSPAPPGPYVLAADRIGHGTTMRVVVAPEISHETLVRYGLLDGPEGGKVRAGGYGMSPMPPGRLPRQVPRDPAAAFRLCRQSRYPH